MPQDIQVSHLMVIITHLETKTILAVFWNSFKKKFKYKK